MVGEQESELTDVVLCYQAMGIPLDASPAAVDQRFKSLADDYRKKLEAGDAAAREDARVSLELMGDMYQKIRTSVTFNTMAKEHQKREANAAAAKAARPVHKAVAEKRQMVNCPRCNGLITKGTKFCPICKSEILSLPRQIAKRLFTPKNLIIGGVALLLISLVALYLLRPELFPGSGPQPAAPAAAR